MLDRRCEPRLALKPRTVCGVRGHLGHDRLHRDPAVEPELGGPVDDAHPAATGDRVDPAVRDRVSDCDPRHGLVIHQRAPSACTRERYCISSTIAVCGTGDASPPPPSRQKPGPLVKVARIHRLSECAPGGRPVKTATIVVGKTAVVECANHRFAFRVGARRPRPVVVDTIDPCLQGTPNCAALKAVRTDGVVHRDSRDSVSLELVDGANRLDLLVGTGHTQVNVWRQVVKARPLQHRGRAGGALRSGLPGEPRAPRGPRGPRGPRIGGLLAADAATAACERWLPFVVAA